jgi:hypothetical protein
MLMQQQQQPFMHLQQQQQQLGLQGRQGSGWGLQGGPADTAGGSYAPPFANNMQQQQQQMPGMRAGSGGPAAAAAAAAGGGDAGGLPLEEPLTPRSMQDAVAQAGMEVRTGSAVRCC